MCKVSFRGRIEVFRVEIQQPSTEGGIINSTSYAEEYGTWNLK